MLDGNYESVKMLVEFGVNVNKKDRFGWIVFYYVVSEGYEDICWFFLRNGVNFWVEDKDGKFFVEVMDDEIIFCILLRVILIYNMLLMDRELFKYSC